MPVCPVITRDASDEPGNAPKSMVVTDWPPPVLVIPSVARAVAASASSSNVRANVDSVVVVALDELL